MNQLAPDQGVGRSRSRIAGITTPVVSPTHAGATPITDAPGSNTIRPASVAAEHDAATPGPRDFDRVASAGIPNPGAPLVSGEHCQLTGSCPRRCRPHGDQHASPPHRVPAGRGTSSRRTRELVRALVGDRESARSRHGRSCSRSVDDLTAPAKRERHDRSRSAASRRHGYFEKPASRAPRRRCVQRERSASVGAARRSRNRLTSYASR